MFGKSTAIIFTLFVIFLSAGCIFYFLLVRGDVSVSFGDDKTNPENIETTQAADNNKISQLPMDIVVRTPEIGNAFLSDLVYDKDIAFEDEAPFYVIVRVMVDPSAEFDSVKLYETDNAGKAKTLVAELFDGGNVANGDDIAEDGVYSGKVNLMSPAKGIGQYYYRAFLDDGKSNGSSSMLFYVVKRVTDEDYEDAETIINNILTAVVPSFNNILTYKQFIDYKDEIMAALGKNANVKEVSYTEGDDAIGVEFHSGIKTYIGYQFRENIK